MKDKNDIAKGEFQHRMFKLIIVIIAIVFCGMVGCFIYMALYSSSNDTGFPNENYTSEEQIIQSNQKYYDIIINYDMKHYLSYQSDKNIFKCDTQNFYKNQIVPHLPCIQKFDEKLDYINVMNKIKIQKDKNHLTQNDIGVIDFIDKYMKIIDIEVFNQYNNNDVYFKIPRLDNIGKIIINNSDKKVHIIISPISQIKNYNSIQNKSNSEFVNFYLKNNIDDKIVMNSKQKNQIFYEFDLDNLDLIYVPSYYFIQIKEPVENLLIYEYYDISSFHDNVFKILYKF